MSNVLAELNNRDIALLAWLAVILAVLAISRSTRKAFAAPLKMIFCSWYIGGTLLAMATYTTLVVFLCYQVHLWQWWMLKVTLFWFFVTAMVMFFSITEATKNERYFKKLATESVKFALVLDFLVNLYVFNLVVELLLLPFLALLWMLVVVAGTKQELALTKKVIERLTVIIGFGFLLYAITNTLTHFQSFATLKNLQEFLLPIALTIAFLPFIYMLALFSVYQVAFARVKIFLGDDKKLARFAKRQIMKTCLLSLRKITRHAGKNSAKLGGAKNTEEIARRLSEVKTGIQ